ncbi:IclR family transcriptional regulator [Natronorarus salvus]|uniref:IclR family transcriptional regulator n=1 Tax=Natronorarus salvus TaxID=3117733 RepID=UPI002F26DD9D
MVRENRSNDIVKSDETLFAIIEILQHHDQAGVTMLANSLGMAKSSVHKHLKTLEKNGYVINKSGKYQLGFKLLSIGGAIRDSDRFCNLARESVQKLVEDTNQMVIFSYREGLDGVVVFVRNDRYGLRNEVPLGNRFSLHMNAAGKAILAKLADPEIEEFLRKIDLIPATPNTITSKNELWDEIERVREKGYAISKEERVKGVQSIAGAVESGGEVGAISISLPADYSTTAQIHTRFSEIIVETANELELRARYKI